MTRAPKSAPADQLPPPMDRRRLMSVVALLVVALLGTSTGLGLELASSEPCEAPSYCERHPSRCKTCAAGDPSSCGAVPVEWICCDTEGEGGCIGVVSAVDCAVGWDLVGECDWGASTVDPATGKPAVDCYE